MSKKSSYIFVVVTILAILGVAVYLVSSDTSSDGSDGYQVDYSNAEDGGVLSSNKSMLTKSEAGIMELTEEQKAFIESSGFGGGASIPNSFDSNKYSFAMNSEGQSMLVVNDDKVVPLKPLLSAVAIGENKVVVTVGDYQGTADGSKSITGDKKAYIYNINNQTSKVFYTKDEAITDLFAIEKDGKIVLSLGNRIDVYDLSGGFLRTAFTSADANEQIMVTDQQGVGEGMLKIYSQKNGFSNVSL